MIGELFIVIFVAALAVVLHGLVQRRFQYNLLSRHNDVAGLLLSVVGVIYAVVLGFVVIVAWQKYDEAQGYVDDEVAAVTDLYHAANGLPVPLRDEVRTQLRDYAHTVIVQEWPAMARGTLALGAAPFIERVATKIEGFRPANDAQSNIHALALEDVQRVFDARRQRIRQDQPSVPSILWYALVAGAAATLGFAFLFGVENRSAQLVMTGIVAGLVAIMFVVIGSFDRPFEGAVAIQPAGWQYFEDRVTAIDRAGQPLAQ